MAKQWFVVHTYSGYEKKVRESLLNRIATEGLQERFGDVLIPAETVVEMKKGKKKTGTRSFFPGYLLVNMELDEVTWHLVRHTRRSPGSWAASIRPPYRSPKWRTSNPRWSRGG